MTENDLSRMLNSLGGRTPKRMQRMQQYLASNLAAPPAVSPSGDGPIRGTWRDDAELMDQIVEDGMRNREHR